MGQSVNDLDSRTSCPEFDPYSVLISLYFVAPLDPGVFNRYLAMQG